MNKYFKKAAAREVSKQPQGKKGIAVIRAFLDEAMQEGFIDGYSEEKKERQKESVFIFRVRAAFSEERYDYASLRRHTWPSERKVKQGVVEPRSKLVDYYFRLRLIQETGMLELEFTVQGYAKLVKDVGATHRLSLESFDRRKTNPFFSKAAEIIERLHPAMEQSRDRIMRRLDRLTSAVSGATLPHRYSRRDR